MSWRQERTDIILLSTETKIPHITQDAHLDILHLGARAQDETETDKGQKREETGQGTPKMNAPKAAMVAMIIEEEEDLLGDNGLGFKKI